AGYPAMAYPWLGGYVASPNLTIPFANFANGPFFSFPLGGAFVGGGYGVGGYGATSASLAYGVGDEGALKAEIAKTMARQATPEFVAQATRNYNTALAQAAAFDDLRAGLGVSREVVPVAGREDAPRDRVRIEMKKGTVEGTLLEDDGEWVKVRTA